MKRQEANTNVREREKGRERERERERDEKYFEQNQKNGAIMDKLLGCEGATY